VGACYEFLELGSEGGTLGEMWLVHRLAETIATIEFLDCLVIEDFVLYLHSRQTADRSGLAPVRITAMLELANFYGIDGNMPLGLTVYKYLAREAKGSITDERLKRWGCWIRGKPHARDAMRLLILHLRKTQQTNARQRVKE